MSYVVPSPLTSQNPRYGLTLAEVAEWANKALADGVEGDAPLDVKVNFVGGAKAITVVTGPELEKRRARLKPKQ